LVASQRLSMKPEQGAGTERRTRVLVIDAEPSSSESLRELLAFHHEVELAEDGPEALERARSLQPDLVLVRAHLPPVEGLHTQQMLRREARTENIPIIFLAPPDEEVAVRCLQDGATDVVAMPVRGRELLARIDRALRESRERGMLQEVAQTDALTQLPNFRALERRIEHEFQRALRYGHPLSAVTIDLDHLKEINDRFGHEAGNRAIIALAGYLEANLREADFAARFGGDEFVVLLPHQTPSEATVFAERIRHGLLTLRVMASDRASTGLGLTVSAGIAGHWPGGLKRSAQELLRASDRALFTAKRRGRDRVVVFENDPDEAEHHA
jgi:two-component system, cell cycle response regulator